MSKSNLKDSCALQKILEYFNGIKWSWESMLRKSAENSAHCAEVSDSHDEERAFWLSTAECLRLRNQNNPETILRCKAKVLSEKMHYCTVVMSEQTEVLQELKDKMNDAMTKYVDANRRFDDYKSKLDKVAEDLKR